MNALQALRKLLRDCSGSAALITAGAMPVLIGSAGLAIDVIQLSYSKRQLQRMADSAALAGAHAVSQQMSAADSVRRDLELNTLVPLTEPADVRYTPTTGAYRGNDRAVEVVLTFRRRLPFLSFFTSDASTLTARAVASRVGRNPHCILALDTRAPAALEMTGNANMTLGCGIASNSTAPDAVRLTGNLTLNEVADVTSSGGIEISGNASVAAQKLHPNSATQSDPFGHLEVPTSPSTCTANNLQINDSNVTLRPGLYCGFIDINGRSNVTFEPGTYIIAGEFFKINGQATVSGNGVTFILTNRDGKSANMDWNGNATIDLRAPTVSSGSPYAGVLVMSDRRGPTDVKHHINGNLNLSMRGALYFPTQEFFWNGNTTGNTDCLQLVSRQIVINGNPVINNDCTADDGILQRVVERVRLVE